MQDGIGTVSAAGAGERLRAGGLPEKQLREIAQGFESLFVHMLLKSMRSTIKKSEVFNGGRGEEMFTDLMDMQIGEAATRRGRGIGIAEMIVKAYSSHLRATEDSPKNGFDTGSGPPGGSEDSVAPGIYRAAR